MELDHLWRKVRELLTSQRLAVLCSDLAGTPYCNLVAFAATADLKTILFATTRASRKYRNLQKNSAVSLLIDNRSNDPADFHRAVAITVMGGADLNAPAEESLKTLFLEKHPHLEPFLASPTVSLIMIPVDSYILVERFQDVKILKP